MPGNKVFFFFWLAPDTLLCHQDYFDRKKKDKELFPYVMGWINYYVVF